VVVVGYRRGGLDNQTIRSPNSTSVSAKHKSLSVQADTDFAVYCRGFIRRFLI
jgi:hypothetical protein